VPIERQAVAAAPAKVINLMDALRRSIAAEKPARAGAGKTAERKKPAKGARKAS